MCGEGQGELSSVALVYMPFRMRKLRASGSRSGDVVAAVCFMFTIASSLLVVAHCIAYVRSGQAMRLICASSIKVSAIGKMEEAVPSAIIGNTTKFAAHPKGNSRAFESQPRTLPPTMACSCSTPTTSRPCVMWRIIIALVSSPFELLPGFVPLMVFILGQGSTGDQVRWWATSHLSPELPLIRHVPQIARKKIMRFDHERRAHSKDA